MADHINRLFADIARHFEPKAEAAKATEAEIIDIIENAMMNVHDMDVPFRDYAKAVFKELAGEGFIAPAGVANVLTDCAQFMDGMKNDGVREGWWSDWDQQVRDRISDVLREHYAMKGAVHGTSRDGQ